MVKISVDHIAFLARLELSEEEREEIQRDLSRILEAFAQLQEAPVKSPPLFSVGPPTLRLREDIPRKPVGRDVMLRDTPDRYQHFVRVPSPLADVRKRQ